MGRSIHAVKKEVQAIFRELAGKRSPVLEGRHYPYEIAAIITKALDSKGSYRKFRRHAKEIAFNLVDWNSDAAFLVALHLFPERFTPSEIRSGIVQLLLHAPAHVIAAARLGGYSTKDILK
jgi:hypothetical protein